MAVRSRRVATGVIPALSSSVNVYTVPAGRTLIVKTIEFGVDAGTPSQLGLRLFDGVGTHTFLFALIPASTVVRDTVYRVFNPGDVITASTGANPVYVIVYGVLLLGAPS